MAPKSCAVSFTDLDGSRHAVDVTAESLYEAAVLALKALRNDSFLESAPGPATRLEVEIKNPTVRHAVTIQQSRRASIAGRRTLPRWSGESA